MKQILAVLMVAVSCSAAEWQFDLSQLPAGLGQFGYSYGLELEGLVAAGTYTPGGGASFDAPLSGSYGSGVLTIEAPVDWAPLSGIASALDGSWSVELPAVSSGSYLVGLGGLTPIPEPATGGLAFPFCLMAVAGLRRWWWRSPERRCLGCRCLACVGCPVSSGGR